MSPLEELTRDQDFWLQDGSVVLVAEKTAFKVYAGLLSAHSPVFSGLFSPTNHPDETYDGCPVVRMPDSPEDFKWLLTHLIPKSLLHLRSAHVPGYPELSALARLGHKYQIDALEKHAHGPPQGRVYEQRRAVRAPPRHCVFQLCGLQPDRRHPHRQAHEQPQHAALAFLLCAQNEDIIIDGQARGPGKDGALLVLNKADAKRCIAGIYELCQTSERALQQTRLAIPVQACCTPTACRSALDAILGTGTSTSSSPKGSRDIYLLKGLSFRGCDACKQVFGNLRRTKRRELWKQLPRIFGLQAELKGHWPES
uniref:Methionyl-tRNA formyltransferase (EC) n=1 Tax=Ganoderma boninense TaxID=34458 RepID=A0A5K1JZE7_9APHY|nr:Methionyl-tRNA formyltransferase (EC [Ganoderma boninense]